MIAEPLIVVISRKAVTELDVSEPLSVLRRLISSPSVSRGYCERVDVAFHGYDDDSRELWEIPEVREFVYRLDEQFPYWLFFLNREGSGLYALARCFLLPHLTAEGEAKHNRPKLADLLTRRWFPALNQLAEKLGLDEDEIARLSDSAVNYFVGPASDPGDRVKQLLEYATADGRVCPNPQEWAALHNMLQTASERTGDRLLSAPLILAAWWDTPDWQKQSRFHDHIRYAASTGVFDAVERYVRSLPDSAWHKAPRRR